MLSRELKSAASVTGAGRAAVMVARATIREAVMLEKRILNALADRYLREYSMKEVFSLDTAKIAACLQSGEMASNIHTRSTGSLLVPHHYCRRGAICERIIVSFEEEATCRDMSYACSCIEFCKMDDLA